MLDAINNGSRWKVIDLSMLFAVLALIAIGLTFVYSATHSDGSDQFAALRKQATWFVIGLIGLTTAALVDYRRLQGFGHVIYAVNMLALLAVMFVGEEILGAQRWITIGPLSIQPSEFSKLLLAVALAAFLSDRTIDVSEPRGLLLTLLYVMPPWLLIFIQPDLGTSLVIISVLMGILLVAGLRMRHFLIMVGVTAAVAFAAIQFHILKPYQMQRLLVFLDPQGDPSGAGYNLNQSQIAIGSGGFSGKGLFEGTQSTLNFLPHHDTDFIFSVIGEEWGFLGGFILMALFMLLLFRGLMGALAAKDRFGSLLCAGLAAMIFFQVTVNVGMTLGIMPITGIPLPFISSGGSSLVTSMTAVGIMLGVQARRGG